MGVRQKLGENKKVGVGLGAALIIIALGMVGLQFQGGRGNVPEAPVSAFYTVDNGTTFFKDDINKVVPFDHNGKQAYRADVFRGPDGTEFVGLIYRHTATGRNEMQDYIARNAIKQDKEGDGLRGIDHRGMDVKRAGADDRAWSRNDELKQERLREMVRTPSGESAVLVIP